MMMMVIQSLQRANYLAINITQPIILNEKCFKNLSPVQEDQGVVLHPTKYMHSETTYLLAVAFPRIVLPRYDT